MRKPASLSSAMATRPRDPCRSGDRGWNRDPGTGPPVGLAKQVQDLAGDLAEAHWSESFWPWSRTTRQPSSGSACFRDRIREDKPKSVPSASCPLGMVPDRPRPSCGEEGLRRRRAGMRPVHAGGSLAGNDSGWLRPPGRCRSWSAVSSAEQHRHHLSSTGPAMLNPDAGPVGHQGERLHRSVPVTSIWIHVFRNQEPNGLPMH